MENITQWLVLFFFIAIEEFVIKTKCVVGIYCKCSFFNHRHAGLLYCRCNSVSTIYVLKSPLNNRTINHYINLL